MKKVYIMWLIALFIVSLIISAVPAMANDPEYDNSETELVPPLSDPSKIDYDALTKYDLLNPKNPNYDPSLKNGPEGTRFGPPGKNTPNISELSQGVNSPLVDQQCFGTNIFYNSNIFGVYANQSIYNNINLNESGDNLFAPTIIGPNQCPLEMTTEYKRAGSTTSRGIRLWKWNNGQAQGISYLDASPTFMSSYTRGGRYLMEILYVAASQKWRALLYNYDTSMWASLGPLVPSQTGGQTSGWDIWEEWYIANNWPTLPFILSSNLKVKIGSAGDTWTYVTPTYGNQGWDLDNAPYPHFFINYYYLWNVGPGPQ
jgi:hypothetical protein